MVNDVKLVYLTFFLFIVLLFGFLVSGNTLNLLVSLANLGVALLLIINIKKYKPKLNYLVFILILALQGLTLVYTYLFQLKTLDLLHTLLFYFFAVIWILLTSFLILSGKSIIKDLKKNKELDEI